MFQGFVERALLRLSNKALVALEQIEAGHQFEDPGGGPVPIGGGRLDQDGEGVDPLEPVDHRPERLLERSRGHLNRGPPAAAFQPLDQRPGRAAANPGSGSKGENDFRLTPERGRQHGFEGDA